ncbi:hypothetical protein QC761_507640 [Podospora bellae-mahoneyi]|uniref:GPI inositol-deacylase n=1 Tax=Podospora bellae-mahoneyi TaxID=2093777 RepID=A0ABR0FEB8_9PEZI|nr:hypothetical protein QC761_507640 [Podospora bellae-mahoneyi]
MSLGRFRRSRDRKSIFDISFPIRRLTSHSPEGSDLSRATKIVDDGVDDAKGPLGLNTLHAPPGPTFDLVLVHGLGGGSRKTWSKTTSLKDYWPAEWLPKDPAFTNVRIHSYGYNSDWTKRNDNCLNVHHIGKAFLGDLATSPHIDGSNTNLVLIGHSMGGLVVKKAYMLARQDPLYQALAARVRAIFFLGTPHRGSDSAKLLKNILQVASSAPAYVTDLVRGSGAIQSINDEFRQYSADVELWSLYETQKLAAKGFSTLIVDPESATLGYREERQIPINADHRSICKFDTPLDPNYVTLRNALASSMRGIAEAELTAAQITQQSTIQDLADFLSISDNVDDDFFTVQDARVEGTCRWLLDKSGYQNWKNADSDSPSILWIDGKPATGKTVLSGFVIDDIYEAGSPCSYYFFKHSEKSKSKLSSCLRTLAFQMAMQDAGVLAKLSELQKTNPNLDLENERSIWRSLFISGILPAMSKPHFWVLDALDECSNAKSLFESILCKMDGSAQPLNILVTSRETPELLTSFTALGPKRVLREQISTEETLPDIERLVASKAQSIIAEDDESRGRLVKRIIDKSKGSFLWTQLVLDELADTFSEEAVKQVLDEVPRGMEQLYHRALETMTRETRGKPIIKAVLEWTTCALRPLTILELNVCLEIQLRDRFPQLQDTIAALCGQLVSVDKLQRVQIIHETAREFLLDEGLRSDFAIDRVQAHTNMAQVCLTFLTGNELRPARMQRRLSTSQPVTKKRSALYAYACTAFSYHLSKADPSRNDLLSLLDTFLKANILTWIDHTAQGKSLGPMVRSAKELRTYTERCMAERSPLRRDLQRMKTWAKDLQRIAAKFSAALLTSPSAIYSLILPFCPEQSAIHDTSPNGKRISIVGLANLQWDDRLSCINLRQEKTSAICYGEEFLAVGVTGGRVGLYHPISCQEYRSLNHCELVMQLAFKANSNLLATCGLKSIRIWNIRTGELLQTFPAPRKCVGLWFDEDHLVAVSSKNEIWSWDIENEGSASKRPIVRVNDSHNMDCEAIRQVPAAVSVGIAHKMLAVAYSGKPIVLWYLQDDQFYGYCGKKLVDGETAAHPIQALQFNPNPNIELLAASYLDGDLVIIDPFSDHEIERKRASCHTLSASADGRLLAGGGGGGVIQIFEFDTLNLLYKVRTSDLWIKSLAFSLDGKNLADLRGSQCNVWMPPVLLAGSMEDDVSVETSNTFNDTPQIEQRAKIECVAITSDGVICGKDDGSVTFHDIRGEKLPETLYSHKAAVQILSWVELARTILSVCVSNRVLAWSLGDMKSVAGHQCLLDIRPDYGGNTITHILAGYPSKKLILSTRTTDHLWDMEITAEKLHRTYDSESRTRIWVQQPASSEHVVCVRSTTVDVYPWNAWSAMPVLSIALGINVEGLQLKSRPLFYGVKGTHMLIELEEIDGSADTKRILAFDLSREGLSMSETPRKLIAATAPALTSSAASAQDHLAQIPTITVSPTPCLTHPTEAPSGIIASYPEEIIRRIAHVIGIQGHGNRSRLVFLDSNSWVCSTSLPGNQTAPRQRETHDANSQSLSCTRHFFIPYDWLSGVRHMIGGVARGQDVVFAKDGDVAIVKGGFDFEERVDVSAASPASGSSHGGNSGVRAGLLRVPTT